MVLVEGRKGGRAGLAVEAPLFVYDGDRYSEEVLRIYGEG
jgi:tRNA1Val (adenine37-N6)-methyltransferase